MGVKTQKVKTGLTDSITPITIKNMTKRLRLYIKPGPINIRILPTSSVKRDVRSPTSKPSTA